MIDWFIKRARWSLGVVCLLAVGCAEPEYNPTPTVSENDCLSQTVQLTSDFDKAGEGYFSPDMNWIIFQAVPHGEKQYQMYLAPFQHDRDLVNIGQPIRISPANSQNACGFFSPDGNSLIFASTAGKQGDTGVGDGPQRVGRDFKWSFPRGMEIFRADGWPAAVAAHEPGAPLDLAKHSLTDNDAYDAGGAYSPDGKWICFTSQRTGDLDVYVMRSDGTHVLQITKSPGYDGGAVFTPDGKHLLYCSDRMQNTLQIFEADLAFDTAGDIVGVTAEHQLTHDGEANWEPYTHPDGKHIVYTTSGLIAGKTQVFLMRCVDGSHKTRVTFSPAVDRSPVFSPDGIYLMWTSTRGITRTPQLFISRFRMPPGT